jgi:U3 small nucleolar RNA-associated protein 15
VYNGITKGVDKSYSRFKTGAFGGRFRQDGRLLCAGSAEAELKLFDVNSKSLLRTFSGHTG